MSKKTKQKKKPVKKPKAVKKPSPKRKTLKRPKPPAGKKKKIQSLPKGFTTREHEVKAFEDLIRKISPDEGSEERLIEEAKFETGIKKEGLLTRGSPTREFPTQTPKSIPNEYNVDRVVLLTVDPTFVFAYWEVRTDSMNNALARLGKNTKLTLRFYDISPTRDPKDSLFWDIEVFDRLGNWYLKLDRPDQVLSVDIGMKNEQGIFMRIAGSNSIKLPSTSLAEPKPLKWMVVSPDGEKVVTEVEEYTDADLELLRKILGPYFFDLFMKGKFASITGSSMEAVFQNFSSFR